MYSVSGRSQVEHSSCYLVLNLLKYAVLSVECDEIIRGSKENASVVEIGVDVCVVVDRKGSEYLGQ